MIKYTVNGVQFPTLEEATQYKNGLLATNLVEVANLFIVRNGFEEYRFETLPEAEAKKAELESKEYDLLIEEELIAIEPPNWRELEQALWQHPLMAKALTGNPNGFSLFLKVLTDGKTGDAVENSLLFAINLLGISFSEEEKTVLNNLFTQFHFTIQI